MWHKAKMWNRVLGVALSSDVAQGLLGCCTRLDVAQGLDVEQGLDVAQCLLGCG